jgi:hypothetical protein
MVAFQFRFVRDQMPAQAGSAPLGVLPELLRPGHLVRPGSEEKQRAGGAPLM